MKIFKYPVTIYPRTLIRMRQGAKILCVQMQREEPMLWAAVDPIEPAVYEDRIIYIVGTGHDLGRAETAQYIGTLQMLDSRLVWHVFDGGTEGRPA